MAPQVQRNIIVGVLTTVLGVAIIALASAAKASVVPRGTYDLHVQADSLRWKELEGVLERLDQRTARIDRYICRSRPNDLGC